MMKFQIIIQWFITTFFCCIFSFSYAQNNNTESQSFELALADWTLQAMKDKTLVINETGAVSFRNDTDCSIKLDDDGNCDCPGGRSHTLFKPGLLAQSRQSQPITFFDGVHPEEPPYPTDWLYEYCGCLCKGINSPKGKPVWRSHVGYFYNLNAHLLPTLSNGASDLPNFLKIPKHDIDVGVYDMADFERVDTSTGNLKLVHHDIHYPGNAGMDINLYRVSEISLSKQSSTDISAYNFANFAIGDSPYNMSPGFMVFNGLLCQTRHDKVPVHHVYYDEQFNRHVFSFDEKRYELSNEVSDKNKRAQTFYSDTGWKGVCETTVGYVPKDHDNSAYYYVKSIGWTLYRPDGREIKLSMLAGEASDEGLQEHIRALVKTQEKDRFGNTINYQWKTAGATEYSPPTWLGLEKVVASDGRTLSFSWPDYVPARNNSDRGIEPSYLKTFRATITDNNNRQWNYIKNQSTMPDGRVWRHQIDWGLVSQITNPFGGVHDYSYERYSRYPNFDSSQTRPVLQSKTFTHADGKQSIWTYDFKVDTQYKIPTALVIAPDNSKTKYKYWNGWTAWGDTRPGSSWTGDPATSCFRKGKLELVEHFSPTNSNNPIRLTRYEYAADHRYFIPSNYAFQGRCLAFSSAFAYPTKTTTIEDGKYYTTEYTYTGHRIPEAETAKRFAVPAWRELKPESITQTGSGSSKKTHYQYKVADKTECKKVVYSRFNASPIEGAKDACEKGTITGHYFVGVTSAKTDGIPLGVTTNYDPNHFRVTSQNTYGVNTSQTWHTSGNSKGSLRTATDAAGNTTSFNDYQRGIPKSETLPTGNSITRTVDNIGVVKSVSVRDAKTNKTLTTTYDHTPIGLLSGVKLPKYTSAKTAAAYTWGSAANTVIKRGDFKQTNYYDRLGRETEKVYHVGSETIRYKTDYDLNGRVQKSYYPNASNGVTYQYDGLGRVVKTCDPRGCSTTQYDGDHVTVTDAKGKATTYTYQRFGAGLHTELVAIRSPENIGTQITRNKKGDILSVRQGTVSNYNATTKAFSLTNAKTRSLSYFTDKGLGLRTVSDPERGTLTYGRDNAGRITTETLDGKTKTLRYDPLNRVDRVTFNRETHLNKTFGYDAWGRLIASNNSIINWAYGYDDNGNPTSAKLTLGNKTYEANYTHDNLDHLETLTYPSGRKLSYDVDALGRVNSIYKGSTGIVRAANYHPNGTVKTLRLGNGSQYTTAINSRQLINLIAVDGNKVKLTYGYDPVGNVSQITQSGQATKTMTYDDLHRLKKVAYSNGGSANYTYDALSNIKTKVLSSIAGATNTNWTYGYDANNRLTGIRGSTYSGFGYDGAGNVIRDGKHSYGYNVNHQLASIDSGERAYAYDANDDRIYESHGKQNSQKQVNFYHGGTLLGEYSEANQAVKREYVQLGNHTIAQFGGTASTSNPNYIFRDSFEAFPPPRSLDLLDFTPKAGGETLTYLYKDALGSTIAKADSTGKILWQENRLPFGKNTQLNNNQIAKNPLQYTNAPLDTHSGLTYLKARYYNAEIGRFYAIDPVWFTEDNPQSFGRYTYVSNNPYRYIDPTGMQGDDVQDMINDLRDARRGGKTKAEFEAHANDTLVDSVKVAGKTAAGIAPLGRLGNFFGKLGSKLGFGKQSRKGLLGNSEDIANFINSNTQRINKKIGKKIGQGRLPFSPSKEGFEQALKTIESTLKNPTVQSRPFTNRNKNNVVDIYSEKTNFTVRVRVDGIFDTLIPGKTDRF